MPDLRGQVTLITGAAGGIGSAIAQAFVAEGSSVVLIDTKVTRLETVSETIKHQNKYANVLVVQADVTKGVELEAK